MSSDVAEGPLANPTPVEPAALEGTSFVIIRHGQSQAQAQGFISGHDSCVGLSDRGRHQAKLLAERLATTGELDTASVFVTSLLERARETASIIAPVFAGRAQFAVDCNWCEMHPGSLEGTTWEALIERADPASLGDPDVRRGEGMETWSEVFERVGTQLRTTASEHPGQRIVVAGHGGTVGSSFAALGGVDQRAALDRVFTTVNTSITEWFHDGTNWKLQRFNDAAHLLGLDA